jgi:hypothetical protein
MISKGSQFIKRGLRAEMLKFGIYLSIPLFASQLFNNPEWSQKVNEYYNYIEYPPEDEETTKMKEDLEDLRQNLEQARRRKMLMKEQLQKLDATGNGSDREASPLRWWHIRRWLGEGQRPSSAQ